MNAQNTKSTLWISFFILNGFLILLPWNLILNAIPYVDAGLEENFFFILTFVFMFGQIVCFLTRPILVKYFSDKVSLKFTPMLNLIAYLCILLFVEFPDHKDLMKSAFYNKTCTSISCFIVGFLTGFYQGRFMEVCSKVSNEEIIFCNFGMSLAGVIVSIFSILLGFIFPDSASNESASFEQLQILQKRVLMYSIIYVFLVYIFYGLHRVFYQKNPNFFSPIEENQEDLLNEIKKETSTTAVLKKTMTLLIGMCLLYVITIHIVVKTIFASANKHDYSGLGIYLGLYYLFYNIFDTIGKYLPLKMMILSETKLHIGCVSRSPFWLFMVYVQRKNHDESAVENPLIRILVLCFLGITNGLFTNSIFCQSINRFSDKSEKGKAGYYILFGLIL